MFALVRFVPVRHLLLQQLPALVVSLFIADKLYKFHSFLLESIAFLVTWFVVDAMLSGATILISRINHTQTAAKETMTR